jgi:shikimate kinase
MNNTNTNITLIGFMGCGKTTIGNRLAYKLKYSFIDSDKRIEDEAGMSITDLFSLYGETYFRNLEADTIKKISKIDRQVIATGGGIIKNEQNIVELKKKGIVLYLNATAEHIYNNLKNDNSRPLLQVKDKKATIASILNERAELYEKYADIIIDVTDNAVNTTVDIIINSLGGKYL